MFSQETEDSEVVENYRPESEIDVVVPKNDPYLSDLPLSLSVPINEPRRRIVGKTYV